MSKGQKAQKGQKGFARNMTRRDPWRDRAEQLETDLAEAQESVKAWVQAGTRHESAHQVTRTKLEGSHIVNKALKGEVARLKAESTRQGKKMEGFRSRDGLFGQATTELAQLKAERAQQQRELGAQGKHIASLQSKVFLLEQSNENYRNCIQAFTDLTHEDDKLEDQENIAPPSSFSSGGAVAAADGRSGKSFTGSTANRKNRHRWKGIAREVLKQFPPEQMLATVAALHEELHTNNEILATTLKNLPADKLKEMIPSDFLDDIEKKAQRAYAGAVQNHWSTAKCLDMKYSAPLSRSKYDIFRKQISGV